MKMKIIIPILIIFLIVLFKLSSENSKIRKDMATNENQEVAVNEVKENIYEFSAELPEKNVNLNDFYNKDHRSMSVYLFDNRIVTNKGKDRDSLVIKNQKYPSLYEYAFYSDVELLSGLSLGTAKIDDFQEINLITKHDGSERKFVYYEKKMNDKVYRKYSFTYGDISYLISVEMDSSKEVEYTELTNKMLATIIPHTMSPEAINNFLNGLGK